MLIEPNLPKKSKKKPQVQTQNEHIIAIDKIIHKTSEHFQSLHDFLKQFEEENIKSISEHFSDLNLQESSSKAELRIFIEESYKKTFMNLNSVVKSKIDHLRMLQLWFCIPCLKYRYLWNMQKQVIKINLKTCSRHFKIPEMILRMCGQ